MLASDHENFSVEYLARTQPGHTTGVHRHYAEAYIFILEGSATNRMTGVEFHKGDFCYQPVRDEHEEIAGPNGAMVYVSQLGDQNLMAEFLNDAREVIARYSLSDFAAVMQK